MSSSAPVADAVSTGLLHDGPTRLDYLDATRAFALVLGVVFHAGLSFMPVFMGWAVMDISTSPLVGGFILVSHAFRMELFFLLAGFFAHASVHRRGTGAFVRSRLLRLGVPFVAGWFLLRPLLVSGWIMGSASLRGNFDFWAGLREGVQSLQALPAGLFTGSHLWFLYYLAMITALVIAARASLKFTGLRGGIFAEHADRLFVRLVASRFSLLFLAGPTALVLWFMGGPGWGMATPDQSLRPHGPVLLVYGGFFLFGWILDRQRARIEQCARLSAARWTLAGIAIVATFLLSAIEQDPSHPYRMAGHVGYVVSYALMMWSLVFLSIGVFRKYCAQPRPWLRYVADSSYWMYLIHLPLVVWLQVAVAELPLHWSFKLAFISAATVAVSLLTYALCVRSTWLGWLLNGRRLPRPI